VQVRRRVQLSALAVLHYDVEIGRVVVYLINLDDVGMFQLGRR
jgi:hypothetical protein